MADWFDDDAFWEAFGPILFGPERMAAAPSEARAFLALASLPAGAPVLDLGCGPGRHSLALARAGHPVTAVDRTAAYLDRLAADARTEGLDVETVQADMRAFERPAAFAGVLSAFTSFGYFADPADDLAVARRVRASLRPDGVFVLDVIGKEVLARGWQERFWTWRDATTLLLEERQVLRDFTWVRTRWTLLHTPADGPATRRDFTLEHRLYSAAELRRLLIEAGFGQVRICGGLDGRPYDQQAERLVAVARPGGLRG